MENSQCLERRKTHEDKEVLQLVDRDAMEANSQAGERKHFRGRQKKDVFEPSTAVYGNNLDSSTQRRLDI